LDRCSTPEFKEELKNEGMLFSFFLHIFNIFGNNF
jgi:hypothetical protein